MCMTCVGGKIYSKHWALREEALESIHRAMAELDPSAGKDEAILLMRGALIAINKAIRDNVFAVSAVCVTSFRNFDFSLLFL
jgi:hypothetical protein